ncbi:uncharacterized protein LOC141714002 [Apium graveolens]|uniref:uncharacterized protein LOC141714002 n=1 Tax=Apium graveolens TaxID=4045 RepID=UPI003D7AE309
MALAHKITHFGFYRSKIMVDAKNYVKNCDHSQKHAPVVRQPPKMLNYINSPIPFAIWGMNFLGPFPMATAQRRYKIPRILVTDKGTQLNNEGFKKYYEENEIELLFTSVAHRQANGQAEVANWIIIDGLKKRSEKSRNNWVDEIVSILWAYRTICMVTMGTTRFMLAYRAEAVVNVEISHSSPMIQAYNTDENEEGKMLAPDLIDEVEDEARANIMKYRKKASFYYNLRVNKRFFKKDDLVLRKVKASRVRPEWKACPELGRTLQNQKYSRRRILQVENHGWGRSTNDLACT